MLNRVVCILLVVLMSSFTGEVEALTTNDLVKLQEAVEKICGQPDQKGDYLKIEGDLSAGAVLRVLGVSAEGKITKEQWEGISNVDSRECAIKLMEILAPLLTGDQIDQLRGTNISICNDASDTITLAALGFDVDAKQWLKRGWYHIKSQTCHTFHTYRSGMFYYYAYAGSVEWTGNMNICIDYTHRFSEINYRGTCNEPYIVKQFKAEYIPSNGHTLRLYITPVQSSPAPTDLESIFGGNTPPPLAPLTKPRANSPPGSVKPRPDRFGVHF